MTLKSGVALRLLLHVLSNRTFQGDTEDLERLVLPRPGDEGMELSLFSAGNKYHSAGNEYHVEPDLVRRTAP